jgi:methyl halide transferase
MDHMTSLDKEYWNERYQNKTAVWDVGEISTPLKHYIDQLTDKDISILIPGCGNAYEAAYLLQHGFTNITLIDLSPLLVNALKEKMQRGDEPHPNIICGDFFELDQQFDLIIEQTFFCALDTRLRESYVSKMYQLLKPGGKLVGLLFNRTFEGGPPFGGSKVEYEKLFSEKFEIISMEVCYNSIPKRAGSELFVILKRM